MNLLIFPLIVAASTTVTIVTHRTTIWIPVVTQAVIEVAVVIAFILDSIVLNRQIVLTARHRVLTTNTTIVVFTVLSALAGIGSLIVSLITLRK